MLRWEEALSQAKNAETLEGLREIHRSLFSLLRSSRPECGEIARTYALLSRVHDGLMQRALQLAEQHVKMEGIGIPPEEYCWLVMGSAGRRELTVWADQDNGIIYRSGGEQNDEQVQAFLERLAERGVAYLRRIGYPLCPGNVMATNRRWRKTECEWKEMLGRWMRGLSVDDVRFLLIAADFRVIYGAKALGDRLRNWFATMVRERKPVLLRLAEHATVYEVPIGIFGQIFTERWGPYTGKLDLKHGVYVHFVNGVRLWALANGIEETSTLERIARLAEQRVFTEADSRAFAAAFSSVLCLRLWQHMDQGQEEAWQEHHIDLKELPGDALHRLKEAMKSAKKLQQTIRRRLITRYLDAPGRFFR
ncbi:hypothetical protein BSNK01_07360 [Bacillaceae bacterium]